MSEDTLIKTMRLPHGRLWEWFADLNVVALCPSLDAAGREWALSEVQAHWRRSCLRAVGGVDTVQIPRLPTPVGSDIRQVIGAL